MLWWAALCFGSAAVIALLAPLLLTVGRWQLLHPRSALISWFGAFFLGMGMLLVGFGVTVSGAIAASESMSAREALVLTAAGWLGLGVFGGVTAHVSMSAEPLIALHRATVATTAPVPLSRERRRGFTIVRFDSDEATAYAMPGRRPEIFVSSAMEELLSPAQLDAVLAHEYAHIRQRHGWAMRIAQVNTLCLSRVRPGNALERATRLLVELAADDAAGRQAGAANLANALTLIADGTGDSSLHLRAMRLTDKRWPKRARRRLPKAFETPRGLIRRPAPRIPTRRTACRR